jgi:hypothetical protein
MGLVLVTPLLKTERAKEREHENVVTIVAKCEVALFIPLVGFRTPFGSPRIIKALDGSSREVLKLRDIRALLKW